MRQCDKTRLHNLCSAICASRWTNEERRFRGAHLGGPQKISEKFALVLSPTTRYVGKMRPRKNYSTAVELYEGGSSLAQIASVLKITRQAVWAILRCRGVTMRPQTRSGEANPFYRHGEGYVVERRRALNKVTKAIKRGLLIPQPCECCGFAGVRKNGTRAVHAHHDDYSKPLEVRWLCRPCHYELHAK